MKKLLSALLIATMLIASVTCVLAVSAEDGTTDSNILANLMPAAGEGEGYKITANADGSVTIKLTAAATTAVNIKLPMPEGTTFDNDTNAIIVMEYKEGEGAKIDKSNSGGDSPAGTWVNYSRKKPGKDELNDGYVYLGTMLIKNGQKKEDGSPDENDAYRTNNTLDNNNTTPEIAYGTFDVGKYAAPNKPDSGKHKVLSAQIGLTGTEGAELTIYSFALVKSIEGLTLGEGKPLVAPAVTEPSDDTSSDDSSAADTSSDDSSAADTSSDDSSAADTSSDDSSAADTSSDESSAVDTSSDESSVADTSSDESSAASTSSAASSAASTSSAASSTPASSSSNSPTTGDTGLIVFVVLAVLATVGGVVIVRARH